MKFLNWFVCLLFWIETIREMLDQKVKELFFFYFSFESGAEQCVSIGLSVSGRLLRGVCVYVFMAGQEVLLR